MRLISLLVISLVAMQACAKTDPMLGHASRALTRELGPDAYFTAYRYRSNHLVLRVDTLAFRGLTDSAFARRAADLAILAVDSTGHPSQFESVSVSAAGWMRRGFKETVYRHCTFALSDLRTGNVSPAVCVQTLTH